MHSASDYLLRQRSQLLSSSFSKRTPTFSQAHSMLPCSSVWLSSTQWDANVSAVWDFLRSVWGKKGHTLLPPLFPSGFWNVDVMAGAQAAILNKETICYGWQQNIRSLGPWWLWFYLTNPRLPTSLLFLWEDMTLTCLSHCYSGITYNMQQNLVLTNIPFDAQKSKLNLYFSFCNTNNHASVFYLP